ncbi:MAG: TonB-dependent siderophore receptor [Burkholderiales bacterium]|nr:TonB-dependent siderophore receptor [Burkholderiales bacterium]
MHSSNFHPSLLTVAIALALSPTLLHAQTAPPAPSAPSTATAADDTTLPAVVVTGTADRSAKTDGYNARRSDSALGLNLSRRETPQSVSVITRQQIDDFALTGVNQMLSQATGINVERVETDRSYYTARGFDVQTFQFNGIGMPLANGSQWGDLDTALFERVDVLRGANGLLTATGNPSATINFVRKRPTSDSRASAGLTLGSWNDRRVEGDVSGALSAEGGVRGRLVVIREKKDSYLDRYGNDKTVVSGDVEADLGRDTRLNLGYTEQHSDARSPMWGALPLHYTDGTPTNYKVSTSSATDWAFWNNADRRAHAELAQELGGDWQLKTSLLYRTLGSDSRLFYVYGTPDRSTGLGLYAYPSTFGGDYAQSTADLRLSGPVRLAGRSHELLFGVNWGHEKASERSEYGQGIGADVPELSTWNGHYPKPSFDAGTDGSHWRTTRRSAFAAARLNLANAFKLIAGANATHVQSSGTNYGVDHAYARSALTPYLGLVADLGETVSAYASYTRIFNPQTEVDVNHQVLAPIQGRSVEAGLKSESLDKRLTGSLAVFRTQQDNTAEAAGSFANFQTYYKGVNATSAGFEAELTGRLAAGWDINAGYTQFRLKGEDGRDARSFVPRRMLRMASNWQPGALPGLRVGAAIKFQGAIYTFDGTTRIDQAAYALLDLMARYEFSQHVNLALNLNNATDKKYLTSLYWTQAYYAAPRNVSATLRWTY